MSSLREYLIRAHEQEVLRAAYTRRAEPCAKPRHHRFRRPRPDRLTATTPSPAVQLIHPGAPAPFSLR